MRTLFFSGICLLAMPFAGKAQTTPTFVNGSTQSLSICENATIDITPYLNVNDPDVGQTENYTFLSGPSNGTMTGIPNSAASGSTSISLAPGSVMYTPTPGSTTESFTIQVDDGVDGTSFTTFFITINGAPTAVLGAFPSVCNGTTSATLSYSGLTNVGLITVNKDATGLVDNFVVPAGVTSLGFDVFGAAGGVDNVTLAGVPGNGGEISGTLTVSSFDNLIIRVGGLGYNGSNLGASGGFNGGGNAFYDGVDGSGGGGGGASDIRMGGTGLADRVVVAGGGGGSGYDGSMNPLAGGDGGGASGSNGATNLDGSSAGGGTPVAAGAGATFFGYASGSNGALVGGPGGDGSVQGGSGGGGAGWFGGGGGVWTGGGGGSSYADPSVTSSVVNTGGANTPSGAYFGNGHVTLTYNAPGTYAIAYSGAAHTASFVDVPATPLPGTDFPIAIPANAPAAIYTATLTISNGICSTDYPFTVEVKQTPDVNAVANQAVCDGSAVAVSFSSTIGTTPAYNWTNDNTGIGAPASGVGNIAFTAVNTGTAPSIGTFTVTPTEFGCTGNSVSFTILTNPRPMLTLGTMPQVCAGATMATVPFSGLQNVGPSSITYPFANGNTLPYIFTVPQGVTNITFDMTGGIGGSDDQSISPNPGKGGHITGVLNVNPFDGLNIFVGGRGFNGSPFGAAGGFNGGGNANYWPGIGCGGGGGGASDIRLNGLALTDRVVVVGGGGGNGWDNPVGAYAGGAGGGLTGGSGANNIDGSHAWGGTQLAGGAGATFTGWIPGSNGSSGFGGDGSMQGVSGGGGGGWFGGGGGIWTGGGGGSSYADPAKTTLVTSTQGTNIGNGSVTIGYTTVGTYAISNWSGGGFSNVAPTTLPLTSIPITVPPAAAPGTYTADLTIDNGICSNTYTISVTVNALPDVNIIPSATYCNGTPTTNVNFTGSIGTTVYDWTNDNSSIGLASTGTGDILSFTAANTTPSQIYGTITVTPTDAATGCVGLPMSFADTVNPSPTLSSASALTTCNILVNGYTPTSATTPTTFSWTRAMVFGVSNAAGAGSNSPGEVLDDTLAVPVTVPYVYTLSSNGCLNTQTVSVTVNPTAVLTTPLSTNPDICSGSVFAYPPASLTPGTTYAWTRSAIPGISTPPMSGTGAVSEVLTNGTASPVLVSYTYYLTAYGCTNGQVVQVVVKPTPTLSSPLVATPICSGDLFTYPPTSGTVGANFSWSHDTISGGSPARYGTANPSEILVNNNTYAITYTYTFATELNGCSDTSFVNVSVNPIPKLSSSLTPPAVCSGDTFNYHANSLTSPVTYFWIRPMVYGVNKFIGSNTTQDIIEPFTDTTVNPVTVAYAITVSTSTGKVCSSTDTVKVVINPTPMMTSSTATIVKCDENSFLYHPTSSTPGATFAWSRGYTPGIQNLASSGTGDASETLKNTTNTDVTVKYVYTVKAYGCPGPSDSFYVTIHPNATLSSDTVLPYVCTGVPLHYVPTSYVSGASFDWRREIVKSIGPALTNFGTGNVDETLVDTAFTPRVVIYDYRVTANGCTNLQTYHVRQPIYPGPDLPDLSTNAPSSPCSNMQFQTFGATAPPAAGVYYSWYAYNATLWSNTSDHQYAYVNFNFQGKAYVRLTGEILATGCKSADSLFVNVTSGIADNPKIVYYEGEFICLQSNMDTYQWGYDDAATFASTTLTGATMQNYYDPAADLQHRRYWVMTTHNGCTQKSYYNSPLGINDVNNNDVADIKVFPNPTQNNINVEINTTVDGDMQVDLLNLLGQKLNMVKMVNHKATIDVSNLPGGCYLVDCYRDGIKIATSRFIKN